MNPNGHKFIDRKLVLEWIAEDEHLWQMDFLSMRKFHQFVKDRGIRFLKRHRDIEVLWQLGLLKSDMVTSTQPVTLPGFQQIHQDEQACYYMYEPPVNYLEESWFTSDQLPDLPKHVSLLFHPFRYLVLCQLEGHYSHKISSILSGQVATPSTIQSIRDQSLHLNSVCDLLVATEPCFYVYIFHYLRFSEQEQLIKRHWEKNLEKVYRGHPLEELEKVREHLCFYADQLDPNNELHTLIRLTKRQFRLKLKGHIGGCSLLLTMAEILRRALEKAYGVELSEEDELGFGRMSPQLSKIIKQTSYGGSRIFDGDRNVARQFLHTIGLDYHIRLRWYVEGATELGALQNAIGQYSAIEIIDLRGLVVQKKILGFRDSLRNDVNAQIFSFISLDADNEKYVRAIRKAAADDDFCGMFFISDPDVEFANFTLDELVEILWELALENGARPYEKDTLVEALKDVESSKELERLARSALPALASFSKGADWGIRLMKFAQNNPQRPDNIKRPIIETIEFALNTAYFADFLASHTEMRVDPSTGKAIPREKK